MLYYLDRKFADLITQKVVAMGRFGHQSMEEASKWPLRILYRRADALNVLMKMEADAYKKT